MVIDTIVPYKLITPSYKHQSDNVKTITLVRKKRSLLKRWKKNGRMQDKLNANKLNIEIRNSLMDTKKQAIRRKIIPGNSKTLWDATKIAMDKECILYILNVLY